MYFLRRDLFYSLFANFPVKNRLFCYLKWAIDFIFDNLSPIAVKLESFLFNFRRLKIFSDWRDNIILGDLVPFELAISRLFCFFRGLYRIDACVALQKPSGILRTAATKNRI